MRNEETRAADAASIQLTLPNPEDEVNIEIRSENLYAAQTIYFGFMLDEMRLFQVVEHIVELFQQGRLAIGHGPAADALMQYTTRRGERISEAERRDLYMRVFGAPGGSHDDAAANHAFFSLWMRFLAAVAAYAREQGRTGIVWPPSAGNARVRRSARALAADLSAHVGGMIEAAAEEVAEHERQLFEILHDDEVQSAFGARDAWQVVDRIGRELGGARNVARYRAQGQAGARVLRWLADNAGALSDHAEAAGVAAEHDGPDLIDAVERWLAASGLSEDEDAVEQDSTPTESPAACAPLPDIPAIARELLDAIAGDSAGGQSKATLLFHGARRTGKTFAAYVLAEALTVDVWRIDLAALAAKHIDETERNLDILFATAEKSHAVLLFDEADALFGRRTEVTDAHDRYANLVVDALPRRIEDYNGVVILTTNLRVNLDETLRAPARGRRLRTLRFPLKRG